MTTEWLEIFIWAFYLCPMALAFLLVVFYFNYNLVNNGWDLGKAFFGLGCIVLTFIPIVNWWLCAVYVFYTAIEIKRQFFTKQ